MAPAWFTVVGVIIGAFIGGGAQIAVNLLTREESRRQQRREARQQAYSEFLTAANQYVVAIIDKSTVGSEIGSTLVELSQLTTARWSVEIVAPQDTADTARAYYRQLQAMAKERRQEVTDGQRLPADERTHVNAEHEEFLRLAKRDVSLSDDPTVVPPATRSATWSRLVGLTARGGWTTFLASELRSGLPLRQQARVNGRSSVRRAGLTCVR